jgi:hypothetical protein
MMIVRVVIGAVLGAAVLMGWGAAFWMVLPFGAQVIHDLPHDETIVRELKDADVDNGFYVSPAMRRSQASAEENNASKEKYKAGPILYLTYRKDGVDLDDTTVLKVGAAHFVLCALIAGFLLAAAAPTLRSYLGRVVFIFLLGVFGALAFDLSNGIWFYHPWGYPILMAGFHAAGWLLAGIVMAAVIRAPRDQTA